MQTDKARKPLHQHHGPPSAVAGRRPQAGGLGAATQEPVVERLFAELRGIHEALAADLREIRDRLAGAHKPLLTIEEVADLTGRTAYTIRRWVKEGRLDATRVRGTGPRGRLLVAHDQLQRLIAQGVGGDVAPGACGP